MNSRPRADFACLNSFCCIVPGLPIVRSQRNIDATRLCNQKSICLPQFRLRLFYLFEFGTSLGRELVLTSWADCSLAWEPIFPTNCAELLELRVSSRVLQQYA